MPQLGFKHGLCELENGVRTIRPPSTILLINLLLLLLLLLRGAFNKYCHVLFCARLGNPGDVK